MTPEAVLALMLLVGPAPGRSTYSVVEVAEGSPAPCSEARITCRAPWRARDGRWLRYESKDEALARYATIAEAVAELAPDDTSVRIILAITREESGWRRDVHSGRGPNARGDDGRSWCLGQFNLGAESAEGRKLVGVERAATGRCVARIVDEVERFRARCKGSVRCVFVSWGSIRVDARMRTFRRLQG